MSAVRTPVLVCVSGLPATGKSTICRLVVAALASPYVRVDTLETAITRAEGRYEASNGWVSLPGYEIAYDLAAEQLRHGLNVVAEAVNATSEARQGWWAAAKREKARLLNVEVVCSDRDEHRRRAEQRTVDVVGLTMPSWQEITGIAYAEWTSNRLVIDTSKVSALEAAERIGLAATA
jgi:predicted kinase